MMYYLYRKQDELSPCGPFGKQLLNRPGSVPTEVPSHRQEIKTQQQTNGPSLESKVQHLDEVRRRNRNNNIKRFTFVSNISTHDQSQHIDRDDNEDDILHVEDTIITTIPPTPDKVYAYATVIEYPQVSPPLPSSSSTYSNNQSRTKFTIIDTLPDKTPTRYTYEHTSSFDDSGIADYSPQLSPSIHDTSSSSLREVKADLDKAKMSRHKPGDRRFLKKVQRELEDQRTKWESEVDSLSDSFSQASLPENAKANQQGENSYVDTSTGRPIFKAFIDVSGYSKNSLSVNVDNITNKVLVTAVKDSVMGNVTNTFTQKISLPRFADDEKLKSHLSKKGILKIEVPLLYYFQRPDDAKERDRKAKSFVYQVEDQHGQRVLEILVNTGSEYSAKELKVLVQDDRKLVIVGEKMATDPRNGQRSPHQKLIKQYSLPGYADVDHITSKMGKDGRLQVNVPIPSQ